MNERFKSAERLLPALFVSADLAVFHADQFEVPSLADDITQGDEDRQRAYRRLDLDWYQWLYHAMSRAKAKAEAGQISNESWQLMRQRFAVVWRFIRDRYTPDQIAAAEHSYSDARYLPPLVRDTAKYFAMFGGKRA